MKSKEIIRKAIRKQINETINESFLNNLKKKVIASTQKGWRNLKDGAKRESSETKAAAILVGRVLKGKSLSAEERKFVFSQTLDVGKIFILLGIQAIPASTLLTPTLLALQKKYPKISIFPKQNTIPDSVALDESFKGVCPKIKTNYQVDEFVKKFESGEDLLRRGGLPNAMLDYLAFGVTDGQIKRMPVNMVHIKWTDDMENVEYEIEQFAKKKFISIDEAKIKWARLIDLSTPIDIRLENDKYYVEDGHHRYTASKILNKKVLSKIEVYQNPILKLTPDLGYDDFHRCLFKQVVD